MDLTGQGPSLSAESRTCSEVDNFSSRTAACRPSHPLYRYWKCVGCLLALPDGLVTTDPGVSWILSGTFNGQVKSAAKKCCTTRCKGCITVAAGGVQLNPSISSCTYLTNIHRADGSWFQMLVTSWTSWNARTWFKQALNCWTFFTVCIVNLLFDHWLHWLHSYVYHISLYCCNNAPRNSNSKYPQKLPKRILRSLFCEIVLNKQLPVAVQMDERLSAWNKFGSCRQFSLQNRVYLYTKKKGSPASRGTSRWAACITFPKETLLGSLFCLATDGKN